MLGDMPLTSVFHSVAGLILLALGFRALTVRKAATSGHTVIGEVYFWLLTLTLGSAMLVGMRDPAISPFEIATPPTFAAGLLGYVLAKRRPSGWLRWHIVGQAVSYIGVVTAFGFQVFPRFLPDDPWLVLAYWTVPALVGNALIFRTMRRWSRRIEASKRPASTGLPVSAPINRR